MPKGGPVFRVGGKILKINEKRGCFFKYSRNKGGKLLETVVSTLQCSRFEDIFKKLISVSRILFPKNLVFIV